jgi:hypothetical protein
MLQYVKTTRSRNKAQHARLLDELACFQAADDAALAELDNRIALQKQLLHEMTITWDAQFAEQRETCVAMFAQGMRQNVQQNAQLRQDLQST